MPAHGVAETLRRLAAEPRPAGGEAEARARAYCAERLRGAGFTVTEQPFEYSQFPGRYATSAFGLLSIASLAVAGHFGAQGQPRSAALALGAGAVLLAAGGLWMARRGVLHFPLARAEAVNLVAERGAPKLWLVAHLDSKSQPVPMVVRAAGLVLSAVIWLAAVALAAAQLVGAPLSSAWMWVTLAGVVAGAPVVASIVGQSSAGAVDNASGVTALLAVAGGLSRDRPLGVLVTSAEELGLAGARVWSRGRPRGVAINCDGVDDDGRVVCMYSGRRPERLIAALRRAARRAGVPLQARRLIPGILVDGVALADAGWEVATLSRGNLRTLSRIHRPSDTLDRVTGAGIPDVAKVLLECAGELA
jgi:acetylornithine deacetylase/succinyl-diaminopimelate desuccinylase-like protein